MNSLSDSAYKERVNRHYNLQNHWNSEYNQGNSNDQPAADEPTPLQKPTTLHSMLTMENTPIESSDHRINYQHSGRIMYLQERMKQSPHDKFEEPLTTNQSIGWEVHGCPLKRPRFGHVPMDKNDYVEHLDRLVEETEEGKRMHPLGGYLDVKGGSVDSGASNELPWPLNRSK